MTLTFLPVPSDVLGLEIGVWRGRRGDGQRLGPRVGQKVFQSGTCRYARRLRRQAPDLRGPSTSQSSSADQPGPHDDVWMALSTSFALSRGEVFLFCYCSIFMRQRRRRKPICDHYWALRRTLVLSTHSFRTAYLHNEVHWQKVLKLSDKYHNS